MDLLIANPARLNLLMLRSLTLAVLVVCCCTSLTAQTEEVPNERRFLRVPEDYSSIQSAIDAASPNDIVAVRGRHVESIVIAKPIVLRGYEGTQISSAVGSRQVILVKSPGVTLRQLRLVGANFGIDVESGSTDLTLNDVRVNDSYVGMFLDSGCHDAVIVHSGVVDCFFGFLVQESNSVRFVGNVSIENTAGSAFSGCEDAFIVRNRFNRSNFDGFVINGFDNFIFRNEAVLNRSNGFLIEGEGQMVFDNEARKSDAAGFDFSNATGCQIEDNYSRLNAGNGFTFGSSSNGHIIGENLAEQNGGSN